MACAKKIAVGRTSMLPAQYDLNVFLHLMRLLTADAPHARYGGRPDENDGINAMKSSWRTAWQGQDIVVFRNEAEVDRLHAPDIERVVLVHRGSGDSPGDLVQAVVEIGDSCLIFPADTGFAGRVNFERQVYWAERGCVYWVNESRAPLPLRL